MRLRCDTMARPRAHWSSTAALGACDAAHLAGAATKHGIGLVPIHPYSSLERSDPADENRRSTRAQALRRAFALSRALFTRRLAEGR